MNAGDHVALITQPVRLERGGAVALLSVIADPVAPRRSYYELVVAPRHARARWRSRIERKGSMKTLRDFLSVVGCVLLVSGLCVFGQGLRAQVGLPLPGAGSSSGAPSGSGWDPSGKGTQTSLTTTTVANDTVQATSAGFTSVRGMHGRSSGKFYYEVVALATATGNSGFGSMGASSARALDNPLGFISNSAGVFTGAEHFATGTGWQAVSTGVYRISNANVFGVALDMTNGFGYLAKAICGF